MLPDPGVLHSTSFAKYAVAFFRISFSSFSRAFSARSRESSICSGVITLVPWCSLPLPASLHPVPQRLLHQPQGSGYFRHALAAPDQHYRLLLELRGVLLLRNPFHLFPPVNVNATTLRLEVEIRSEAQYVSQASTI